jgi:hypothetical protein
VAGSAAKTLNCGFGPVLPVGLDRSDEENPLVIGLSGL